MSTFDVSLVQGGLPCGYAVGKEEYLDLIAEYCGCKPSRWDGCKALEVAPQIRKGAIKLLMASKQEPALQSSTRFIAAATYVFLHSVVELCMQYPNAQVEVRF